MDKHQILKRTFGYDGFRPGQGEVVDALLGGRDVLSVMPTGAGKSLCYQVPALCMEGTAVVISPLISLMQDQVGALREAGVPAACLNSTLGEEDYRAVLRGAYAGAYRLLYVAPERLDAPGFLNWAQQADIPLVAVDEAHCVSQWGQDFRPSYLNIPGFLAQLRRRPAVGAFTATATPEVRRDILQKLELRDPALFVTGFDRPNLYFAVQRPKSKKREVLNFLAQHREDSGIIYCNTRKNVEMLAEYLTEQGISVVRYHGGLDAGERRLNQEAFAYGGARIMVATNAFGMGIDKSDVRFVLHYNMPLDLESYYQEAGRAGRDGDRAYCLLLYGGQDEATAKFLIQQPTESDDDDPKAYAQRVERDMGRLKVMTAYCHTTDCLRGYLLRYFGERAGDHCGSCGNCQTDFVETDITVDAQKILSCVKRAGERFGAVVIADILRGAKTDRIRSWQLDKLTTYGIMDKMTGDDILARIRFLVEGDHLRQSDGQYPTLSLGPRARGVLFQGEKVVMRLPKAKAAGPDREQAVDDALFQILRQLRATLASRRGVPPYFIFSDKTLHEMCRLLPRDTQHLLEVPGVGVQKLEQYGQPFLQAIRDYLAEKEAE